MNERTGLVKMGGDPVTLCGTEVKEGDAAPAFTGVNGDLEVVSSSAYAGKVVLIVAVTSLDTSVCDIETRRFNQEATSLGDDVVVLTISMDLPFAQARWCGAAGVENVVALSDHRDASFGTTFGVLMKETRLLARSVFVVDRDGTVRHAEIVEEVGTEPDYEAALATVRSLA